MHRKSNNFYFKILIKIVLIFNKSSQSIVTFYLDKLEIFQKIYWNLSIFYQNVKMLNRFIIKKCDWNLKHFQNLIF